MKKRSFILLEILITLALISITMLPLIAQPIFFYKKELSILKELELKRLTNIALLDIREKLLKNQIPWEHFTSRKITHAYTFSINYKLKIPDILEKETIKYCKIWTKQEKKHLNKTYRKIAVQITDNPFEENTHYFTHFFCIQKKL